MYSPSRPSIPVTTVTDIPILENLYPLPSYYYYDNNNNMVEPQEYEKLLMITGDISPDNLIEIIRMRSRKLTSLLYLIKQAKESDELPHQKQAKIYEGMNKLINMPENTLNIIMPCILLFLFEYKENKVKQIEYEIKLDKLNNQINSFENLSIKKVKEQNILKEQYISDLNILKEENIYDLNILKEQYKVDDGLFQDEFIKIKEYHTNQMCLLKKRNMEFEELCETNKFVLEKRLYKLEHIQYNIIYVLICLVIINIYNILL